jgi:hypothetical protein
MRLSLWASVAAFTFAFSATVAVPDAHAEKSDKAKAAGGGGGGSAKRIGLAPAGLKFGLGLEGIARLYDKVLDEEYLPLYKKASPGPQTDALDAELKQRKGEIRRSKVEFGNTPTGVDQTALKGEYSYANGESMVRLTLRSGTERFMFFFGDKLWKVYDEHKLKKGTPMGETFDSAVKSLQGRFGTAPKKVPANPEKGQNFDEAVWTTPDMVIRAIDRGNVCAVVYADKEVQEELPKLRRNKPKNETAMDPDVAAVLKKNEPPPGPPPDTKKDPKAKKK